MASGRTGYPFAANMYGVSPDMITTAKALGAGFPCAALLMADHVAGHLQMDDLGTTFGGGPMACAMIEAVVDIIESESLLANVRKLSQQMRDTCVVGPVTGTQGAGFLLGLRTRRRRRTCSVNCSNSTTSSPEPVVTRTSSASSRPTCSSRSTSSSYTTPSPLCRRDGETRSEVRLPAQRAD